MSDKEECSYNNDTKTGGASPFLSSADLGNLVIISVELLHSSTRAPRYNTKVFLELLHKSDVLFPTP